MSISLVLMYRLEPGKVIPNLHVASGFLSKDDLEQIENWLRENYRDLVGNSNTVVKVPRKLISLPAPVCFRLEAVVEQAARNPMLRLEYQVPKAGTTRLPIWAQQLLATLESELMKTPDSALSAADRKQVVKALADLKSAVESDPQRTAQDLLQGFNSMRGRHLRTRFAAQRRKLARTASSLARFQGALPKKAALPGPDPVASPEKEKPSAWSFPFFG